MLVVAVPWFAGCTCCVYFNHQFNAERAFDEGAELQANRQDSTPSDSTIVTSAERAKFERAIEKGSRVLERYPDDTKYVPRAIWVIAESFRRKGDWSKAVLKYDELERYFPEHDSVPQAEYWRAWCLWRNREYSLARFALEQLLAKGKDHPRYGDALALQSLLDEQADRPESAIAALEAVLAEPGGSPYTRARARQRLAELYYRLEKWQKAYDNYQSPDLAPLSDAERLKAQLQSAECLVHMERWKEAARLLSNVADSSMAESRLPEIRIRIGEVLLHTDSLESGVDLLLDLAREQGHSELGARAWYALGGHYEITRQDFPKAESHYDSSYAAMPSSSWGKKARERRESIRQLLAARERRSDPKRPASAQDEFQIAELFLFRLDRVDSALGTLNRLVDSMPISDTALIARAAYARAFITDEFLSDTTKADSLYRIVLERFPGTAFAQRAQSNLGEKVTVRTKDDDAHDAFLTAEATYTLMKSLPPDSISIVDSLFSAALAQYDTVAQKWPDTREAAKAIYARAWILENEAMDLEGAKVEYMRLDKQYASTAWGTAARAKLNPKLQITDSELDRLRKRVQENEKSADEAHKRWTDQQRKEEEKRKARQDDDEVLENDYNSMYDFQ